MNKIALNKQLLILIFILGFLSKIMGQDNNNTGVEKSYIENVNHSFSAFQDSVHISFRNFQKRQDQAFVDFKKRIEEKWGENNFVYSDSVNWVEYYSDNDARSTVNFKEGNARIEILMDSDEAKDNQKIEENVSKAIKELALNKGKANDFKIESGESNELSAKPVLDQQLVIENGKKVTAENVDQFSEDVISKEEIKRTTIKGTDGKSRMLVSVSIPLAPDYLKVRAEKILPTVTKYANKYGIEPELILSVIHVESYFNPKAISHANAVGLMQLVPSSGGMDSYEYVFGESHQPSRKFLFNPDNNINLGTAYLKLLMTEYFNGITDDESRRHCAISSYNTGVGNVCLTVSGNKIVSNTVTKINRMTSDQTYKYLSSNLKYKEAREYIVKVNEKYFMYKGLMKLE